MSRPWAVVLCPGRGAYGAGELGTLARLLDADLPGLDEVRAGVAAADAAREAAGRPTITGLDGAPRFRPSQHLDGENAAELIYWCTVAHLPHLRARYDLRAVAGNSLGWYTALAVAGVLSVRAGGELVATMARLQKDVPGGQVLTTTVGADWRPDDDLAGAVEEALAGAEGGHFAARSIRLGGHEVLAGTEAGIQRLLAVLPRVTHGERTFPFRLAGHGPFHTRLCAPTAKGARQELDAAAFGSPAMHLIDGRGDLHTPWSADPRGLFDYTTTDQVLETFDFTAAVRTALRELCPDVLVCAAPGTSLRAPVGHVVLREGHGGLTDKEALFASGRIVTG